MIIQAVIVNGRVRCHYDEIRVDVKDCRLCPAHRKITDEFVECEPEHKNPPTCPDD